MTTFTISPITTAIVTTSIFLVTILIVIVLNPHCTPTHGHTHFTNKGTVPRQQSLGQEC